MEKKIIGHERDWLSWRLGREEIDGYITHANPLFQDFSESETASYARWMFHSVPCMMIALASLKVVPPNKPDIGHHLLRLRAQLASLTLPPSVDGRFSVSPSAFDTNMVEGRHRAKYLVSAIVSVANHVFADITRVRRYWQTESTMYWNFGCKVDLVKRDTLELHNIGTCSASLSRVIGALDSSWQASDGLHEEIEAALGLWLWGLKCELDDLTRLDRQGPLHGQRGSQRIRAHTIITTKGGHGGLSLRLWHSRSTLLEHPNRYEAQESHQTNPNTLWRFNERQGTHVPVKLQRNNLAHDRAMSRVFGWYVLHSQEHPDGRPIVASTVRSSRPLAPQCEQEIFGTFLMAVLSTVDIGPINLQEIDGSFQLSNDLVASLVKVFVENGLRSEEDALLCIIPVILARIRTSSLQCAIETAKRSANADRREGRWSRARDTLRWILDEIGQVPPSELNGNSRDSMIEEIVVALAELYRYALADGKLEVREFGHGGIYQHLPELDRFSPAFPIVSRYLEVVRKLRSHEGRDCTKADGWLLSALRTSDLTSALVALRYLIPTDDWDDWVKDERINALSLAASLGWFDVVLGLLELRPRVDNPAGLKYHYEKPLLRAIKIGNLPTVDHILTWSNHDILTPFEKDQVMSDAAKDGHMPVVERLLGIAHTTLDPDPFISAVENWYEKLARTLIANGEDVNARNHCLMTPLHIAVEKTDVLMLSMLLDRGADTELVEEMGATPLCVAVIQKKLEIARLLLERGANVDAQDQYLRTSLHWAVEHARAEIVTLLLDHGADTATVNGNDETPMIIAKRSGHTGIVEMLQIWSKRNALHP